MFDAITEEACRVKKLIVLFVANVEKDCGVALQ